MNTSRILTAGRFSRSLAVAFLCFLVLGYFHAERGQRLLGEPAEAQEKRVGRPFHEREKVRVGDGFLRFSDFLGYDSAQLGNDPLDKRRMIRGDKGGDLLGDGIARGRGGRFGLLGHGGADYSWGSGAVTVQKRGGNVHLSRVSWPVTLYVAGTLSLRCNNVQRCTLLRVYRYAHNARRETG